MSSDSSTTDGPVVTTAAGDVRGYTDAAGVRVFKGVPYAAPPVGPRRYAKAVAPQRWEGTRPCVTTAANALQGTSREVADAHYPLPQPQDEDCLYLNVFTPAVAGEKSARDGGLPVFVYVHSGGYFLGTVQDDYIDGGAFARDGVIFVSVTYRLNGLGFLYLDGLFDGMNGTGNLGITDVRRALEWIQENIAAFGGDPSQVTVGGHSAGGITTVHLMASPSTQGLFHRAVPISSASGHNTIMPTEATKVAERVLQAVGIVPGDLDALMAAPARQLVIPNTIVGELYQIAGGHPLEPVADGDLVTGRAIDALRDGTGSDIAVCIGTMTEEFRGIVFDFDGTVRDEPFRMGVDAAGLDWMQIFAGTGHTRAQVEDVYARSLRRNGREVNDAELWVAAASDFVMNGPSAAVAEAVSANGGDAYVFQFGWRPPAGNGLVGSTHGNDIPFFFDRPNTPEWNHIFEGAAPESLGHDYHDAIVAMTTTGDPGAKGLPDWPRYTAETRSVMVFDEASQVVADLEGERLRLFDGTPGYRG